jgi:hypothetical protein
MPSFSNLGRIRAALFGASAKDLELRGLAIWRDMLIGGSQEVRSVRLRRLRVIGSDNNEAELVSDVIEWALLLRWNILITATPGKPTIRFSTAIRSPFFEIVTGDTDSKTWGARPESNKVGRARLSQPRRGLHEALMDDFGVADAPRTFKGYQSLLGLPATAPAHDFFGQIVDSDGPPMT